MENWQKNAIGTEIDKIYGHIEKYKNIINNLFAEDDPFKVNTATINNYMGKWERESGKLDGIMKVLNILGYELGYDVKTQCHEVVGNGR